MAQQEDPLYDFPEPIKPLQGKLQKLQKGRGSLRSISVLDRLLLTVPVWLQLSINPATALHILQREPPGTFLVRKSRTSQRNILCVRLTDESVPSFVQEFCIKEEESTLLLETSSISFPDLPKLIAFYCVSRDVLPFPLELPEAIAKATSHKELESISHMGIEFWNSGLNVRGPRDVLKPKVAVDQKQDSKTPPLLAAPPLESTAQLDSVVSSNKVYDSDPNATLFQEFCPIMTRSPRELDCGSGLGALCFINPLFPQSGAPLSKRRMFKRSLKVRVSTETCTPLSPPLAPPPPPPLMPKTKGRCRVKKCGKDGTQFLEIQAQADQTAKEAQTQSVPHSQDSCSSDEAASRVTIDETKEDVVELPALIERLTIDYMQPSPATGIPHSSTLSPYQSPSVSPMAPPLFPKGFSSLSPISPSPTPSPSLSPKQSPTLPPKTPPTIPLKNSSSLSSSTSTHAEEDGGAYAVPSAADQKRQGKKAGEQEEGSDKRNVDTEGGEKLNVEVEADVGHNEEIKSSKSLVCIEDVVDTLPPLSHNLLLQHRK